MFNNHSITHIFCLGKYLKGILLLLSMNQLLTCWMITSSISCKFWKRRSLCCMLKPLHFRKVYSNDSLFQTAYRVFLIDSSYKDVINRAMLEAYSDGTVMSLQEKWLKTSHRNCKVNDNNCLIVNSFS